MSGKLRLANRVVKDLFQKHNVKYKISEKDREYLGDLDFDVYVDLSKYHRLGENFDSSYRDFFDNYLEDEIIESLEMVGLDDDLNQIIFHHENKEVGLLMKRFIEDKFNSIIRTYGFRALYDKIKVKSIKLQEYRPGYEIVIEYPIDISQRNKNIISKLLTGEIELEDIVFKFI